MGLQLTGLTVEEVIALLQKQNPKALIVVPSGDGTVAPVHQVKLTATYRYTSGVTHAGSQFLESDQDAPDGSVESVLIE